MNWAVLSTPELGIGPLPCHHSEVEGLTFPKNPQIKPWLCQHLHLSLWTHTVDSQQLGWPRMVQTPRQPSATRGSWGERVIKPGARWGLTAQRTPAPLDCFPLFERPFPCKVSFIIQTQFLSVLDSPHQKSPAFNKALKTEREKRWTCQRLLLLLPLCDRHRGRWLFKFLRQTDNDR